jgi:flagellar motility protein MotE (MotC chaperone)
MQIKRFPHEFLARWGRDGKLQGYHVITVDIACDDTTGLPVKKDPTNPDSENFLEAFSEALPLDRAGVTLEEIMSQVQAAALASVDDITKERDDLQGQLQALQTSSQAQVDEITKERDGLQGQLQSLQASSQAQVDEITKERDDLQGQLQALQTSSQARVDEITKERDGLQGQLQSLQAALDASTPADPTTVQAQVRAIVQQELTAAAPAGTWWQRFLGLV